MARAELSEEAILEKAKAIRAAKAEERRQARLARAKTGKQAGGRNRGAVEKVGVRVFISMELVEFIRTRAEELGVPQSAIVEAALRDRLGMRPLFDIEQALAHA